MTNEHAASQLSPRLMQLAIKTIREAERQNLSPRLIVKSKESFAIVGVVKGKPQKDPKIDAILKELAELKPWYVIQNDVVKERKEKEDAGEVKKPTAPEKEKKKPE